MLKRGVIWSLLLLLLPVVALAVVPTYKVKFAASPVTGGSVSAPDSRNPYPTPGNVGARFRAMANFGKNVQLVSLANPADGVITYDPNFATNGYFTVIPVRDTTLTVTFGIAPSAVYANAGPGKSIIGTGVTKTVTLAGTASSAPTIAGLVYTYQWSISDPNGHFTNPAVATPGFYADLPGSYAPVLVVTAAGKTSAPSQTIVTVTTNSNLDSITCISCHFARSPLVVADYKASLHNTSTKPGAPSCQNCHTVANAAASHPANLTPLANLGYVCLTCHNDGAGNPPPHPVATVGITCTYCHNPHTTVPTIPDFPQGLHYNNITSGAYPASYMTSRATCYSCHVGTAANAVVRGQWAGSGHAKVNSPAWTTYDFKTMAGCVQCHTTTGFIAYSTGKVAKPWGLASDKTKELLTCVGCHTNIDTGAVALVKPVKPFADDSYLNKDLNVSNLCMDCHSGRNNGVSITKNVGTANFNSLGFVSPHYMAAGGILQGNGGYNFPGQSYSFYSSNAHRVIGMNDVNSTGTVGPCVGCHMSATQRHLFKAVSSASGGAIGKITTDICANCHGSSLADTTIINARQASYKNALEVLKSTLTYKGFVYSPLYPYFNSTAWGQDQAGANTMGGAFNYVLLLKDPAAYLHNADYAKKLLIDSIDAVYNGGIVTGSIEGTLAGLVSNGAITQGQADKLIEYKTTTGCLACHPNLGGSHAAHIGDLQGAVTAYGDGANYSTETMYRFGCANCHPTDPALHRNGTVDVTLQPDPAAGSLRIKNYLVTADGLNASGSGVSGTSRVSITCSASYCHSNGYGNNKVYAVTPDWYGGHLVGDKCASCHGNSPSGAIDGSVAHSIHVIGIHALNVYSGDSGNLPVGSSGNVGHGVASQSMTINCNTCHAYTVASARNDNNTVCVSCHASQGNPAVIANKIYHVNGMVDVAFVNRSGVSKAQLRPDSFALYSGALWKRNGGNYKNGAVAFDRSKQSFLNSAQYDGSGGCSNVACHLGQPVNWSNTNTPSYCALCHTSL
jgi:predicted CxxxxCH...CXXCH cytochrome family protein